MNIILIANHANGEMHPLCNDSCLALLPVAGKPLIEHTLEAVSRIEPSSVTIVASRGLARLRHFVGQGEKWGLPLGIATSRPDDPIATVSARYAQPGSEDLLVIECNRLLAIELTEFLAQADLMPKKSIQAWCEGKSAGLFLIRKPDTEDITPAHFREERLERLLLPDAQTHRVDTFVGLHRANLLAASGDIAGITKRGRERTQGLTSGSMTHMHARSLVDGVASLGNHCRVHPSCAMTGNVVVNNGVVIDRNTSIRDSVILDHTFIGENLDIRNAIVSGNVLVRVDTGAVLTITDRFLIAHLGVSLYDTHFASPINRLMGVCLALASIPLWPIALFAAVIEQPTAPIRHRTWLGNRHGRSETGKLAFNTFEFETHHPLLRNLPLVLAIIAGHLRLVGVSLFEPSELENRTDSWQMVRDAAPCGVIGITQLELGAEASLEERMISDAIASQDRSLRSSLLICWRTLCRGVVNPSGRRTRSSDSTSPLSDS